MVVDRGVARRAGQGTVISREDVLHCFGITIALGQAEVYAEHLRRAGAGSYHKVGLRACRNRKEKAKSGTEKNGESIVRIPTGLMSRWIRKRVCRASTRSSI